ncbi:MAG: winged helix-turn-helix transcriptional regulator [Bacteroidetes bacterium]|nr:winged helix-turn-helix transcriptional regulator [Bacteroidota bacterium]
MKNKPNLIDELGELALSTRLMRLSEWTRKDVTRIYKESGIDFESKWFPVLYVLSRRSPMAVGELAEELGYAHPSVIELVQSMQKKQLVTAKPSKEDGRKRLLELTPKARKLIVKMQPLWDRMRIVAAQIYNNGSSLLKAIEDVESALAQKSYFDRFEET